LNDDDRLASIALPFNGGSPVTAEAKTQGEAIVERRARKLVRNDAFGLHGKELRMRTSFTARRVGTFAVAAAAFAVLSTPAYAGPDRLVAFSSGVHAMPAGSAGSLDGVDKFELRGPTRTAAGLAIPGPSNAARTVATTPAKGKAAVAAASAKSSPMLLADWEGVNHRNSRLASGGNQFSLEPPDQGLCVGNGFVLESVNAALRVYDTNGNPRSGVVGLNEFYGLPPAIDRSNFTFPGPFMFDIECHFDPATKRWFHIAASIDQDPVTGATPGGNDIRLAVSTSSNPLGSWVFYTIPGQNDGTEGTPDHDCAGGPCFADFPHLGMDAHGVYITTNEFPFFADGFIGAQVYALPKAALVAGAFSVPVTLFNTADDPVAPGQPGFTVWPAKSAGSQFATDAGGSEFFVSSNAVFDDANGDSNELIVWALTNTQSLNSGNPSLALRKTIVNVATYGVPANSMQKDGTTPLRDCLNDRSHALGPGQNCWELFLTKRPAFQPLGTIDTGDSRVLDVRYANGKVWSVLGTSALVSGQQRTGVGWHILNAAATPGGVSASVVNQGVLALAGASLTYPTVGVTTSGRGVLGFSLVGENNFPSAAFAPIDALVGAGAVTIAEAGSSPQDGFTEYPAFSNRPRWGDYSASGVDGDLVYFATEYIRQPPCTLQQWLSDGLSCFGTRTSLANWSTRVAKLRP
jgi:hypothetical protein